MAKKASLLTIHGMGETARGYAAPLFAEVERRLGAKAADLHFASIYYQHLLQGNEERVWTKTADAVRWDALRKFVLYGFADAVGLETGKEALGSDYASAQVVIARELLRARLAMKGDGPVVVLAHSLGCHVFSCYLWDAQRDAGHAASPTKVPRPVIGMWQDPELFDATITSGPKLSPEERTFVRGSSLRAFFTTGCNIPIFVAAHAVQDIVPFAKPNAAFEWRNFYDKDDVLGWPLAELSDSYGALVADVPMNASEGVLDWLIKSWNPMSHTQYWGDGEVLGPLHDLLASLL
ncbi:MAG: hypothetical protein HYR85_01275 [Planctomycetes bacterium]|nr:hypothetical protein [Planctomycetota bacterium]